MGWYRSADSAECCAAVAAVLEEAGASHLWDAVTGRSAQKLDDALFSRLGVLVPPQCEDSGKRGYLRHLLDFDQENEVLAVGSCLYMSCSGNL